MKRLSLLLVGLALMAGCVAAPPDPDPLADGRPLSIEAKSQERMIREFTVKVRNRGCPDSGVKVGSGFVIDGRRIVTNRHVVAGADELVVTTWDGDDEVVQVVSAATLSDLAVVEVAGSLPRAVRLGEDPDIGDEVVVAGYPQGAEFRLSRGKVIGYDTVTDPTESGDVIAVDATVRQGNSGGPLLDQSGDLVGVVYALRGGDSAGLAIPVSRLERLLERDALDPVEPCSESYVPTDQLAQDIGIGTETAPAAPSTTTTTTYACPTGEPTATVTNVRLTPQPTYWEGDEPDHDTFVDGTVTNRASAAVDVAYVEVVFTHPDGTTGTGTFLVDGPIPPGGSAPFSGQYFGSGTGAPTPTAVRVAWRWEDITNLANCP